MARAYCLSTDVAQYLPKSVVIQGTNPTPNPRKPDMESLLTPDMDFFIAQAGMDIDSALGTMYDTPLRKVNVGGDAAYPPPIPIITAILTAQLIFEQRLQGADRQASESQQKRMKWAQEELAAIQNGERKLFGQRVTRGSRFVRGTLYNAPRNPAEGGRSKGGQG